MARPTVTPGEQALLDQVKTASRNGDMDTVIHVFHQLPVGIRHNMMQAAQDVLAAFIIGDELAHQQENETHD